MKIEVLKSGVLKIDSVEKTIKELNSDLLNEIVRNFLKNECQLEVSEECPLGDFFKTLQKETGEGSELKKEINERQAEISKSNLKIDEIDVSYLQNNK